VVFIGGCFACLMRNLWPQLSSWIDAGDVFALATVTATSGSTPRAAGACMAIDPERLRFIGSVSSGCLDAEIVEAAGAALRTETVKMLRFGPDGAPPWTDGLTCGGWLAVRVEPWWGMHARLEVREVAVAVRRWLERDEAGVVVSGDSAHCAIDAAGRIAGDAAGFSCGLIQSARDRLGADLPPIELSADGLRCFVRTIRRRPRLLIVGGVEVAVHLVALAQQIGWAAIVVDPREAFARGERFPVAPAQLARAWPREFVAGALLGPRDAAIVLTHDPKIDDGALLALLGTHAGYIGALGSTRSHASRLVRLRESGADDDALKRIHGPAGLHLGTPDAAGIALGILAGLSKWQAERERETGGATG
jgi:xanthine dehydrogenase accessory factor